MYRIHLLSSSNVLFPFIRKVLFFWEDVLWSSLEIFSSCTVHFNFCFSFPKHLTGIFLSSWGELLRIYLSLTLIKARSPLENPWKLQPMIMSNTHTLPSTIFVRTFLDKMPFPAPYPDHPDSIPTLKPSPEPQSNPWGPHFPICSMYSTRTHIHAHSSCIFLLMSSTWTKLYCRSLIHS